MAISFASGFGCECTWIETALRVLPEDPTLFHPARISEAMITFGIGNKKVEALGAWLRGMGLCSGSPAHMHLTTLGRLIRSQDAQLRQPGTWWILHLMLALPSHETGMTQQLWQWYADEPFPFGFSVVSLRQAAARRFPVASEHTIRNGLEEVLKTLKATPLASYGLMHPDPALGPGQFSKVPPTPDTFPMPILLAGLARQMQNLERDTLNFEELANLPGGAARAVSLARSVMLPMLDRAAFEYGSHLLSVTRTAGLDSVWLGERSTTFWLGWYYVEQAGSSGRAVEHVVRRLLVD